MFILYFHCRDCRTKANNQDVANIVYSLALLQTHYNNQQAKAAQNVSDQRNQGTATFGARYTGTQFGVDKDFQNVAELMWEAAGEYIMLHTGQFITQGLANMLWAYATAQRADKDVFQAMVAEV